MKNKIYIISLVLLSILYACKDEYEAPMFLADASWLISETNNVRISEGIYTISEGDWISFADLSQGVSSHQWTIDEGCQFMTTGFGKEEEDYSIFVIPGSDSITKDAKAHVYFGEAGLKKVHLYNTFPDSVSFTTTGETIDKIFVPGDTLASYYSAEEQAWVIDTTFTVDVYGTIKPAFSVYKIIETIEGVYVEDSLICKVEAGTIYTKEDSADFFNVNLGMGDELRFIDETTYDRPDSISWLINNGEKNIIKSSQKDTIISFNTLGASTSSIGELIVLRKENGDIPAGETSTFIPVNVTVGTSPKPFEIASEVIELDDRTTIAFQVSGSVGVINADAKSAFTVLVSNVDAGYDKTPIAVAKVTRDSKNFANLLLTLESRLFTSDQVTVSYNPTSTEQLIIRADTKEMLAFGDQDVNLQLVNQYAKNEGFEIEAASTNVKNGGAEYYWDGKNVGAQIGWTRTDEQSAEGDYSMKFSLAMSAARTLANSKAFDDVTPVGTYFVSFKLFIPDGSTITKLSHVVATTPKAEIVLTDLATYPRGEWITIEQEVEVATSLKGEKLSYFVPYDNTVSGVQTFYIDDCKWIHKEDR